MPTEDELRALEAAEKSTEALDPGAPKRAAGAAWGFTKWVVRMIVLFILAVICRVAIELVFN